MSKCNYPNCFDCTLDDCQMDNPTSWRLKNPEKHREYVKNYKQRIKDGLPKCNECANCIYVRKEKGTGTKRLCSKSMRLVENNVMYCPQWCEKRGNDVLHIEYLRRTHGASEL